VVWPRDYACADVAMSQAAPSDRAEAEQTIKEAGPITPLIGLTFTVDPGGTLTVAEQFTSAEVAQRDLKARATLATGPEGNGHGRNFSEDYTLEKSETKDATIVLRLRPHDEVAFPFSTLYPGPLIFATC